MKSRDFVDLMLSPQWVAKLLHYFLCGGQSVNRGGVKIELLYLSLPFVFDDVTRSSLLNAVSTSTFSSIFTNSRTIEIGNSLNQKDSQVGQFREFTNRGLMYLGNVESVNIGKFISVDRLIKYQSEKVVNRDYCRAAYYLGIILAKEDYKNVFVRLGITNI